MDGGEFPSLGCPACKQTEQELESARQALDEIDVERWKMALAAWTVFGACATVATIAVLAFSGSAWGGLILAGPVVTAPWLWARD